MGEFRIYLKNRKFQFCIYMLLTLLSTIILIPLPYLSRFLIDDVLIGENYDKIWNYSFLTAIIIISQLVLARLNVHFSANFFYGFLNNLRERIYRKSLSSLEVISTSFQTVIFNDTELYTNNIQVIVSDLLINLVSAFIYIAIIVRINWKLSFITLTFIPIYISWIVFISIKLKKIAILQQKSKDHILSFLDMTINNFMVIKIYNYFEKMIHDFREISTHNKNLTTEAAIYQNFIGIVSNSIITIASFLPFLVGISFVVQGDLTIGELIAFNSYCGLLFSPITQLLGLISTIKISKVYEARIMHFLKNTNKISDYRMSKSLSLKDISINKIIVNSMNIYSHRNLVLKNINCDFPTGCIILFSGENGSGKSLFLKTISNLYNEWDGKLLYKNNKFVVSKSKVIRNIIYVSNDQKFVLNQIQDEFNTNNIIDPIELNSILEMVGIKNKIESLPAKMNTPSNELNIMLSSGEMQKLRLARALSRKPNYLLLDEIFSNIDKSQSKEIINLIRRNYPNLTLIIVEHHFSADFLYEYTMKINNGVLTLRKN